ncbi:hypothetical protein B0J14DRAFT_100708 [Halenospora varia]|nr:hypothetical protein B0J14DRAFT_100708 [Halenospora varia]
MMQPHHIQASKFDHIKDMDNDNNMQIVKTISSALVICDGTSRTPCPATGQHQGGSRAGDQLAQGLSISNINRFLNLFKAGASALHGANGVSQQSQADEPQLGGEEIASANERGSYTYNIMFIPRSKYYPFIQLQIMTIRLSSSQGLRRTNVFTHGESAYWQDSHITALSRHHCHLRWTKNQGMESLIFQQSVNLCILLSYRFIPQLPMHALTSSFAKFDRVLISSPTQCAYCHTTSLSLSALKEVDLHTIHL